MVDVGCLQHGLLMVNFATLRVRTPSSWSLSAVFLARVQYRMLNQINSGMQSRRRILRRIRGTHHLFMIDRWSFRQRFVGRPSARRMNRRAENEFGEPLTRPLRDFASEAATLVGFAGCVFGPSRRYDL